MSGKNYTYENILLDNVQGLANFIIERRDTLNFEVPSTKISRNDDKILRNFLTNMTPEERRELGINRNTLCYIKKNLEEGKKIMMYNKVKMKLTD